MLEKLTKLTVADDGEESGGFAFQSASVTDHGLSIEILLIPNDGREEQLWRIKCFGVRDFAIYGEFTNGLEVLTNHPVLLPYADYSTELFFASSASNSIATVGALYERHKDIVGDWIPFGRFMNSFKGGLASLLESSSGKLASGPETLLQAYQTILTQHGIKSSLLEPRPPRYWNDTEWIDENRIFALIFEESYVVAERFEEEKIEYAQATQQ